MSEQKIRVVGVEGKRFREIIRDGKTVHQERQDGQWVNRFSTKEYNKKAE